MKITVLMGSPNPNGSTGILFILTALLAIVAMFMGIFVIISI